MRRKAFTLFFLPAVYCGVSCGQQRPFRSIDAVVSSPPALSGRSTNGVLNVQQWCTVPGQLDDTCFTNAISAVASMAPPQNETHKVAVLEVPVGDYVLMNTVVIPNGLNLAILGTGDVQGNIWGARILAGVHGMTMFLVQSDSVTLRYLSLAPGAAKRATAIQLGDKDHYCSTCLIQHDWFTTSTGVRVANAFGVDFSYSTFDSGTGYGIYSSAPEGDVQASSLTGVGVGFWSVISDAIYIDGAGAEAGKYSNYQFQNLSMGGQQSSDGAGIYLKSVHNASFSGSSLGNHSDDFQLYYASGINIGPFNAVNPGHRFADIESCENVVIHDSIIQNPGANSPSGAFPAIYSTNTVHLNVHDNQSFTHEGARPNASYGLMVTAGNSGTVVHGNSFNSQVNSAYRVDDPTASYAVQGNLVASGVLTAAGVVLSGIPQGTTPVCPNGTDGALTTAGCTGSFAKGSITLSAAASDSIPLQGVTSSSVCTFSPANQLAAWPDVRAFYSVGANTFTLNHTDTIAAGAVYTVLCTLN